MSSRIRRARFTRVFSPPDRAEKSCSRMDWGISRPLHTLLSSVAVSYPPLASNAADSSPYRRSRAGSLSSPIFAVRAAISSSILWSLEKAVLSTSSTVYSGG